MKGYLQDSSQQKTERLKKAIAKTPFSQGTTTTMFDQWFDLLCDRKRDFETDALLYALAIKYPELNDNANERLSDKLTVAFNAATLEEKGCIHVMGNTGLKKTEIKNILKELNIAYSTISEKATHILLGKSLSEEELSLVLENKGKWILLTEPIFFDFCKIARAEGFDNPEAINQLLLHEDEINVELGLELLKSNASPKDFLTEIFGIYLFSKNKELITKAEKLLKVYGSVSLKGKMTKIAKEILTPEFDNWLTAAGLNIGNFYRIAYLKDSRVVSYFNKAIPMLNEQGLDRFLDEAISRWAFSSRPQHVSVPSEVDFERFAHKVYQFGGLKELTVNIQSQKHLKIFPKGISTLSELQSLIIAPSLIEFPLELQKLTKLKSLFLNTVFMSTLDHAFARGFEKLEYLKLHLCRLDRLPKGIGNLQQLKVLDISGGDLVELSPELRQLKNLEELNLENNKFKELPEILFLMTQLKKLKIRNRWTESEIRNIEALKHSLPDCEIIY